MQPLQVGQTAPDFTLPTQRGVPTSLAATLQRGAVLLAFPGKLNRAHSHQHVIALARLYPQLAQRPDSLQLLVIVPDRQDVAKRYVEEVGTPFHLLCDDGQVAARYGVSGYIRRTPAVFGVDAAGVIRYRLLASWDEESLGKTIRDHGS